MMCLRTIGVLSGWMWLGACSLGSKSKTEDPLKEAQTKALEEAKIEADVGRNMAGRLLRLYGTYPNEGLVRYVNEVGLYVARYSETPHRRYMFEVYNSESVNAFACPGGYILVSLGAIQLASNEAELAHILGHEIAHVAHGHMFRKLQTMNQEELDQAAAQVSKEKTSRNETDQLRRRPATEESPLGSTLARYITGQAAGLNAIKAAKAGLSVILEEGLGADIEKQADQEGSKLAILAGYDPKALITFLCRMEVERGRPKEYCLKGGTAEANPAKASVLDKTHPAVPYRVAAIQEVLVQMDADQMVGAKGKQRFLSIKQKALTAPASSP